MTKSQLEGQTKCQIPKGFKEELVESERRGKNRDHLHHSSVKIGQDTQNNPGNLRILAVTWSSGKDHHLTLKLKTYKK